MICSTCELLTPNYSGLVTSVTQEYYFLDRNKEEPVQTGCSSTIKQFRILCRDSAIMIWPVVFAILVVKSTSLGIAFSTFMV